MRYTNKDVTIVEGLEVIRRRPSMYIGAGVSEGSSLCPRLLEAALNGLWTTCPRLRPGSDGAFTIAWDGEPLPIGTRRP